MTEDVKHEFGAVGLGRRGGDPWPTDLTRVACRFGEGAQAKQEGQGGRA